jgi:glyoxylase-like metal-dependent hydrolase (beta-lactamase superfamily II)
MAVPRQFDMPCDAYMTTKSEEATVLTQDTNLSLVPSAEANDMANNDGFAKHSFPPNGLVALSRIAYQQTPLLASEVRPGVFVFTGAGGNVTAIAGSPGCTVVDTGFGPRLGEIERSIAAALAQAPRWLINTHWHFDHTDGNSAFAAAGATILAHANCRFRLSRNQYVPSLSWSVSAAPRGAWPTLTFEGPLMLDIGTEQLRLLPQAPAHTDGDIAVFLPSSNVLIMGDLFINGSYPVIDESSGGSLRGMVEALEELLAMIDAKYHCGTRPWRGCGSHKIAWVLRHAAHHRGSHCDADRGQTRYCRHRGGSTDRRIRFIVGARLCRRRGFHPHGAGRNGPCPASGRTAAIRNLTRPSQPRASGRPIVPEPRARNSLSDEFQISGHCASKLVSSVSSGRAG